MLPRNLSLGQAGIYRVASELMLRDVNVSIPVVDVGVDLMTNSGLKLQVKTARLHTRYTKDKAGRPYKLGPAYFYSLSWNQYGAKRAARRRPRVYSEEVDYAIFWGVDEDRFWIVPSTVIDNKQGLMLCEKRTASLYTSSRTFADKVYACEDCWHFIAKPEDGLDTSSSVQSVSTETAIN